MRYYDIVRDSEELKILLRQKIAQRGISYNKLAERTNLNPRKIHRFLAGKDDRELRQWDVIILAKELGVEVELKVTVI